VLGRFENEFVTFVNPCAVKGIAIFLALAAAFPDTRFAAVPTWGTNREDTAALRALPNITLLDPVDDINLLLARTRVLLVPSLWAEARSRIVLESLLRGVPVLAANVGGIPEAMMGVPYLLPVRPIERYETRLDEQMVPIAQVPGQDIGPWRDALFRLLSDRAHYAEISGQSRAAALEYAKELHAGHFEKLLAGGTTRVPAGSAPAAQEASPSDRRELLSADKRKLLALRLRKQATPAAWFPNAAAQRPRLFCFPHAGGGSRVPFQVNGWSVVPVRLPGRESRLAEAPFERMGPLVAALAASIEGFLDRPFAFFGHSMGAVVVFELIRELRRRHRPLPRILIASGARAPQFRRNHVPPPEPTRDQLIDELRRMGSVPLEVLDDPALLRAILPALEADVALYRNYIYAEDAPLPIPIRAYGGTADTNITRAHLDGWAEQTSASFATRQFPGGHFFPNTAPDAVCKALVEDLGE